MQRRSWAVIRVCWALSSLFFALATVTRAQEPVPSVGADLFVGDLSNITLGSWGSGTATAVTDPVLNGSNSIRVTTQGLYQGARLDFKTPVDLAPAFSDPRTYLRFQVRFTGSTQAVTDPNTAETHQNVVSPFAWMRFLITMVDGTRYEVMRKVEIQNPTDPGAWVPVALPLSVFLKKSDGQTLPAPMGEAARVTQIAIFGDRYQQFFVGEARVITDETRITVAPLDEMIAFIKDVKTFTGSAEGGASTLHYSWDFDARDGIQEDRAGPTVQYYWTKAGKYTVTLTVSDVDGIKKPASTSVVVDVGE